MYIVEYMPLGISSVCEYMLKIINPDQVPLTEPYFNLQQVTWK